MHFLFERLHILLARDVEVEYVNACVLEVLAGFVGKKGCDHGEVGRDEAFREGFTNAAFAAARGS